MIKQRKSGLADLLSTSVASVQESAEPVQHYVLDNRRDYPLVVQSRNEQVVLSKWIQNNSQFIEDRLRKHGAILFRDFQINSIPAFQNIVSCFENNPLPYTNRSSPRTEIVNNVYTSTDHPADQSINMHNELSYAPEWPGRIMFYCLQPSETGGETPIADSRAVLNNLSAATRELFLQKGVMYVRNLGGGLGLKWQEVFQATDRAVVEQECRRNNMEFEWKEGDKLQIRWKRPAIKKHPLTGEWIWFNHALFFNASGLDNIIADTLGADSLPFNTFYGDGTPIGSQELLDIRQAFESAKQKFPWQKGDILYLDNHLMSHGREPFTGPRKVAVAMWELHSD
jgi:alpha-ketoglutarate-dependent taurine dioxygenase